MKKQLFTGVLLGLLFLGVAMAKSFEVKMILGTHVKNNAYGEWSIDQKKATDKKYYGKIETSESWGDTYNILENTDMKIIDIPYYKKVFLGNGT